MRRQLSWAKVLALLLMLAPSAAGQGFSVEQASAPAPQELSEAVRGALGDQVLKVSGPNGLIGEIWLRKTVPVKAPSPVLGVTFAQLDEGTLVGALRLAANLRDYRRQSIKAGMYTLRYCLSPVNGDHQGVAPQRDFLLAIPAALDADIATLSQAQTVELSKKSIGANHPSPWPLFAGDGNAGAAPSITHDADDDLWIVNFTVTLGSAPARLGLVISGFGPEV